MLFTVQHIPRRPEPFPYLYRGKAGPFAPRRISGGFKTFKKVFLFTLFVRREL
jgi:hypothetical protein